MLDLRRKSFQIGKVTQKILLCQSWEEDSIGTFTSEIVQPTYHYFEAFVASALSGSLWYVVLLNYLPSVSWLRRWVLPLLQIIIGVACMRYLQGLMNWLGGHTSEFLLHFLPHMHGLGMFIADIGLREETIKLMCVLPFVPWLLKCPFPSAGLLAGAFVGLGYASEENRLVFANHAVPPVLMGRMLSTTVLHFGLTGFTSESLLNALRGKLRDWRQFIIILIVAATAHGLYDWAPAGGPASFHLGGTSAISLLLVFIVLKFFFDGLPRKSKDQGVVAKAFAIWVTLLFVALLALAWIESSLAASRICAVEASVFLPLAFYVYWRLRR